MKEGKKYIAHSPAMDLASSGKTTQEARKNFEEAFSLYLDELLEKGSLDKTMKDLGWKKVDAKWESPVKVTKVISITMPLKKKTHV